MKKKCIIQAYRKMLRLRVFRALDAKDRIQVNKYQLLNPLKRKDKV